MKYNNHIYFNYYYFKLLTKGIDIIHFIDNSIEMDLSQDLYLEKSLIIIDNKKNLKKTVEKNLNRAHLLKGKPNAPYLDFFQQFFFK